jgi:putative acetyltransferase
VPRTLIRPVATDADLEEARRLIGEYAAAFGLPGKDPAVLDEIRELPGAYAPPTGGLWLAEWDREIAGCVALRRHSEEEAEMKRLYTRPAFRGRGVGRALAEHLLEQAAQRSYRAVLLDTLPEMGEAQALYASLGFVEVPRYRPQLVPGTRYLRRELAPAPQRDMRPPSGGRSSGP